MYIIIYMYLSLDTWSLYIKLFFHLFSIYKSKHNHASSFKYRDTSVTYASMYIHSKKIISQ